MSLLLWCWGWGVGVDSDPNKYIVSMYVQSFGVCKNGRFSGIYFGYIYF